jgi:stage V sporulation protein G
MQITEITIDPINDGVVRAYVDIVFDNCFKVEGTKVIQGPTGLFVSFPAKKQRDGSHRDLAYPANAKIHMMMQRVILAEYEKIVGGEYPVSSGHTAAERLKALEQLKTDGLTSVDEKSDENDDTDLVSFRNVFDELREYTSDLCFLCEELKFAGHSDVTHDEYLKLGEYSPLPPYPDYEPFICNDCLTKIVSPKTTTD